MELKYTPAFLTKLEDIFAESDYFLRYEKGNFKSGYCVLKEKRIFLLLLKHFYKTRRGSTGSGEHGLANRVRFLKYWIGLIGIIMTSQELRWSANKQAA